MKIKIGEYEVLGNGTIVSNTKSPIIFEIEGLTFEITFEDKPTTEEVYMKPTVSETGDRMLLNFVNFDSPLGAGNMNPIKLATIKGRELFLNCRIYDFSDNEDTIEDIEGVGKIFHYTWLLKKK